MANLQKHFTLALVLVALTTGFWHGGEGRTCVYPVPFASCEKDRPATCINICRSGLYFPPYLLINSYCDPVYKVNHWEYFCKCLWECDFAAAAAAGDARPPVSLAHPPIA